MTKAIFDALRQPFDPDLVSWRVGPTNGDKTKGMALAYIDARVVMDRLDDVVGPGGWQCRYSHAGEKTICDLALRVDGEWMWKADGAGDTDMEGEKGALSDAFKRAAVRWGIGRYLYDLSAPWVQINQAGKSFVIAPHELARLKAYLSGQGGAQAPAVEDASKQRFIEECRTVIAACEDDATLVAWWNSPEQKQARADFEMTTDEVVALKDLVLAKREQLKGKAA